MIVALGEQGAASHPHHGSAGDRSAEVARLSICRGRNSRSGRMLKKSASFVLATLRDSAYGHGERACLDRLGAGG